MQRHLGAILVVFLATTGCAAPPGSPPARPPGTVASSAETTAVPTAPLSPVGDSPTGGYVPGPPLDPVIRLKVAFSRQMGDSPFVLALERGYFAAEGLDVEFVPFGSSTDALAAVATGELDAMPSGINPALFNMFARGVPVQIVASGSRVGQGYDWYGLLVRNDHLDNGDYKGPRDLRGMKVGIPAPYVSSHYMLKVLLEKNGLSLADVESIGVGLADGVPAIANGAIDALASIEPFLATSERQGYGKRVVGAFDVVPDFPGGLVLLSPGLPERNRLAADRLILAWLRGVRDYLDAFTRDRDREAASTALRKHGIDYSSLVQNPTFDPNGRFQIDGLRSPLDWYLRDGVLRDQIDLSQVVNFEYVDRAAQRLGPYQ